MNAFRGWDEVARDLRQAAAERPEARLNSGQRASLRVLADRLPHNGMLIADEVGMGKTRIAVETIHSVVRSGGRVAILVPPGLGYQWQAELREGGLPVPETLRSLHGFLEAWSGEGPDPERAWFRQPIVLLSHALSNWRLGENSEPWRWALLPELFAQARKRLRHRLPRYYRESEELDDQWVRSAAESIAEEICASKVHPLRNRLGELIEEVPWPGALQAVEYARNSKLRPWLECAVGMGLGVFDLIVVDEAHKSRADNSGLSRILKSLLIASDQSRRLCLTATPVELSPDQWEQIFQRVQISDAQWREVKKVVDGYVESVRDLRDGWRSSQTARDNFKKQARRFERTLKPWLLRRDKREDATVQAFHRITGLAFDDYREQHAVRIDPTHLSEAWQQVVLAAESLSIVTPMAEDALAKRLRLTLANGHGLTAMMDREQDDEEVSSDVSFSDPSSTAPPLTLCQSTAVRTRKRKERVQWWSDAIRQALNQTSDEGQVLFHHPAIKAAVAIIEAKTAAHEKVLVFGRFTRPLRALTELLNAREMLRCIETRKPWPKSKVHGDRNSVEKRGDWPAVEAAHRQLNSPIDLSTLDDQLSKQYERGQKAREKGRARMVELLDEGLSAADAVHQAFFLQFLKPVSDSTKEDAVRHTVSIVYRAITEHLGQEVSTQSAAVVAQAFKAIVDAVRDRDAGEADDDEPADASHLADRWHDIEKILAEELNRPQGGFARFMFGETKPQTRRMLQLAFNQSHSFPNVLVSQSMVGREGLNLHRACRSVLLLHPEWNPGVMEQQIGRVDRVGSYWQSIFEQWAEKRSEDSPAPEDVPRIDIYAVIFEGTYDEHHWKVLRNRWDDYRAQLHGVVVPASEATPGTDEDNLIKEIAASAPRFSPMSR